ncbi:HAD family hydrolase [Kitasatospora sp. NPDC058218]|uniref:HAD family hydrolase n=1 Tax=Kitasatospora sp. NPDC058218 TaxID=3346385 RepID=UPI0036DA7D6E
MTVISAALFGTDWRVASPGSEELLHECAARGWTVLLIGPPPVRAPALAVGARGGDPVRAALDLVDGTPEHAVFVAASMREVQVAHRAQVPCVAVEGDGGTGSELRAAGAAEVHRDVAALLRVLDDSLLARPRAFGDCRPTAPAAPAGRSG